MRTINDISANQDKSERMLRQCKIFQNVNDTKMYLMAGPRFFYW